MRSRERGSALLVTLIVMTAMLAGAALMTSMLLTSTHTADVYRTKVQSLHCAEAGLPIASAAVAANYQGWNAAFASGGQPAWIASLGRDLDGDSIPDIELTIRDNEDEGAGVNDPLHDSDLALYVVSTCTKYPDTPTSVSELVRFSGGGNCYESQLGGCGGNNNAN